MQSLIDEALDTITTLDVVIAQKTSEEINLTLENVGWPATC